MREVQIRILGADDSAVLENVSDDVFDESVRAELAAEFLADPRHHIAVALAEGQVVGFASGIHYVHPDKRPELFIAEVGVAERHRRLGIGARLVEALLAEGRRLGCREAWVATESDNTAARALYRATGGREDPEPAIVYAFPLEPAP